ncbi:MAG: 50S ribosomal protein L3 [Candidatus Levybacteria bacterium GW2011_GWC1_40_19]|nr:MAG: 50S ribosomal protein L3 [Candidatus Levybacteria bacterium GW2011_GWC1_40_19]KKR95353.1 MAG: 50S ribosomal protein L3 [Candidatus Levybacteria bacterium GW2011_GWA2_41_15]KKS01838.1 MAG: 50S ribosomal protein L3 [Candidatus Levybacteria bacterium GW2011_GWB1_41_21]
MSNMLGIIGIKGTQSQKFLENGARVPVTQINTGGAFVVSVKNEEKDKYSAVQLGIGIKKKASRAVLGHAKKAGQEIAPRFLKEIRVVDADEVLPEKGSKLKASDVFKPGDIVDVQGHSKGKGFAGVVKRHGFHGGPKTHGQSDRHRAPGAIGQGTTPGRVYRGKKMAGRMGNADVTLKNLLVVDVKDDELYIKGLVPGFKGSLVIIKKTGESKKFVPLYTETTEVPVEEVVVEVKAEEKAASASLEPAPSEPKAADVENSGEPKEEVKDAS